MNYVSHFLNYFKDLWRKVRYLGCGRRLRGHKKWKTSTWESKAGQKASHSTKKNPKDKTPENLEKISTVWENHRKGLIQHCERSELRLGLLKRPKMVNLATFEKLKLLFKQCYQTWPFLSIQNWKTSNETIGVIFKHCEIFLPMKCQNDGLKLGR